MKKNNTVKPNSVYFLLLSVIAILLLVIFYLTTASAICDTAREALGLTAVPAFGFAGTLFAYYRHCEYAMLAIEQRRAQRMNKEGPQPPAHAMDELHSADEDK